MFQVFQGHAWSLISGGFKLIANLEFQFILIKIMYLVSFENTSTNLFTRAFHISKYSNYEIFSRFSYLARSTRAILNRA